MKITFYSILFSIFILVTGIFFISPVYGAFLRNVPVEIEQPDGFIIECFATGDEFYNWLHDEENYTIIKNPETGYYVYAVLENNQLIPSPYIVGDLDPGSLGLQPGLNVFPEQSKLKSALTEEKQYAPQTGIYNNIVIFIRFADQPEFTEDISGYEEMFNGEIFSLSGYFNEVSGQQLSISSTFYPAPSGNIITSYQDLHERSYYEAYDAITNPNGYEGTEETEREHTLLQNALESVKSELENSGLDFDSDADGYVDNVCFIVQGNVEGWSELLWPHKWQLHTKEVYISGDRVWEYNFQLSERTNVPVLCHEMFHTIGAPDLYHYSDDGLDPVAGWDLMAHDRAQHMTTWMKYKYGTWFNNTQEITGSGTFKLPSVSENPFACYKIPVPESTNEFFIVEYRKKTGYDANLYSSYDEGLLVYRVKTDLTGNRNGPPDELYVLRPGVNENSQNGLLGDATFSADQNRVILNGESDPFPLLSDGSICSLSIYDVGFAGDSIEFKVENLNNPDVPIALNASFITQNGFDAKWEKSGLATGYILDISYDEAFTNYVSGFQNLVLDDISEKAITGLNPDTKYYYRVKAINEQSESGYSNVIGVLTHRSPPLSRETAYGIKWEQTFGGSCAESLRSIEKCADGGYLLIGSTCSNNGDVESGNPGVFAGWVVKTDSLGNLEWEKTYGGSDRTIFKCSYKVSDSIFYIGGYTNSNNGDIQSGNHGDYDYWLIKIDINGNLLWEKTYGGTQYDALEYICASPNGNLLLGGCTSSDDGDIQSGFHGESGSMLQDIWVVEIDNSGNIIWEKTYGGSYREVLNSIYPTPDGGYMIGGRGFSTDGDVQSGNNGGNDLWIIKINGSGDIEWEQTYGGLETEFLNAMAPTQDGGFLLGADSNSDDGDIRSGNHGDIDAWLVKIDSSGNLEWEKTYGGSGKDYLMSIKVDSLGGLFLGGYTESDDGDVWMGNNGIFDFWLIRTDDVGNILWEKTYGGSVGDFLYDVNFSDDGNLFLSGSEQSIDGDIQSENNGRGDYWFVKVGPNTPPFDILLSNDTIKKDLPAQSYVGVLSATDDDRDDTFSYTFEQGEGDEGNEHFVISGDSLLTGTLFGSSSPNEYSIRIRATDNFSNSFSKSFQLFLWEEKQPPIADFITDKVEIPAGDSIHFTDLSENQPSSWVWNFGDGVVSTEQNPSHVYLKPGVYSVSLSVSNEKGADQITKMDYVLVYELDVVPDNIAVSSVIVIAASKDCFNATFTITVAGDGSNVIIESGASADFIAGQSIRFMPGFHAKSGSYVHGHITTTGEYCVEAAPAIVAAETSPQKDAVVVDAELPELPEREMVVYPNPNNGEFSVEFRNFENEIQVMLFNSIGQMVHNEQTNEKQIQMRVPNLKSGMYFIKAVNEEKQFNQKIVVR